MYVAGFCNVICLLLPYRDISDKCTFDPCSSLVVSGISDGKWGRGGKRGWKGFPWGSELLGVTPWWGLIYQVLCVAVLLIPNPDLLPDNLVYHGHQADSYRLIHTLRWISPKEYGLILGQCNVSMSAWIRHIHFSFSCYFFHVLW